MAGFDYETHIMNRNLLKVIGNIFSTRTPDNASPEEINKYEEAKVILQQLKDKAGEGSVPRTQFKFNCNNNLTISQVLRKIETLQVADIQSEVLNLKGELFYKSTLDNNPPQGVQAQGGLAQVGQDNINQRGGYWKRAAKDADSDIYVEASLISFLDTEKKIIEWDATLRNLNRIGDERSYTSSNFRSALMRMLQVYCPKTHHIYKEMHDPDEIANSLLDSQLKLDKKTIYRTQIDGLVRKQGEDLTQVMASLRGLAKLVYPNDEQEPNFQKLMIQGLISFCCDELAIPLKNSIEKDINMGRNVNWTEHFDVIQQLEILKQIKPREQLKFGRLVGESSIKLFNYEFTKEIPDFYTERYKEFLKPGELQPQRPHSYHEDEYTVVPGRAPVRAIPQASGAIPRNIQPRIDSYLNFPRVNEDISFTPDRMITSTPRHNRGIDNLVNIRPPSGYDNIQGIIELEPEPEKVNKSSSLDNTLEEKDFKPDEKLSMTAHGVKYSNLSSDDEVSFRHSNNDTVTAQVNYNSTYPVQYEKNRPNYNTPPPGQPRYPSNNRPRSYSQDRYPRNDRSQSRERQDERRSGNFPYDNNKRQSTNNFTRNNSFNGDRYNGSRSNSYDKERRNRGEKTSNYKDNSDYKGNDRYGRNNSQSGFYPERQSRSASRDDRGRPSFGYNNGNNNYKDRRNVSNNRSGTRSNSWSDRRYQDRNPRQSFNSENRFNSYDRNNRNYDSSRERPRSLSFSRDRNGSRSNPGNQYRRDRSNSWGNNNNRSQSNDRVRNRSPSPFIGRDRSDRYKKFNQMGNHNDYNNREKSQYGRGRSNERDTRERDTGRPNSRYNSRERDTRRGKGERKNNNNYSPRPERNEDVSVSVFQSDEEDEPEINLSNTELGEVLTTLGSVLKHKK